MIALDSDVLKSKITLSFGTLLNSAHLDKMPCDKSHILVAAQPKSGSTWLKELLTALPGYVGIDLTPHWGYREQELAFERLLVYHGTDYVACHHIKFSEVTEAYMRTFSVKPVITMRNFFDCVPSMKDWLDGGKDDTLRDRLAGPTAYIPKDYFRWTDTEKIEFIIDMMIPWYFAFFVSWQDFSGGVWVNYDDLVADPMATLAKVSDELGLDLNKSTIQTALERASQKFTKKSIGQRGRGDSFLTAAQKDKIRKFASYYPTRDFSAVGL